jgi:hypothetical protein
MLLLALHIDRTDTPKLKYHLSLFYVLLDILERAAGQVSKSGDERELGEIDYLYKKLSLPCSIWEEKGKTKMGSVAKKGLQQYMLQLQQHPLRTKVCIWKQSLRFFMCILVCFGFGFDGLLWLRKKSMKVWIFSSFFFFSWLDFLWVIWLREECDESLGLCSFLNFFKMGNWGQLPSW